MGRTGYRKSTGGMPGYYGYELSAKIAKSIADFGKEPCEAYFNEAFRLVADAAANS